MLKSVNQSTLPHFLCSKCDFTHFCASKETCAEHGKRHLTVSNRTTRLKPNEVFQLQKTKPQTLYAIQHGAVKTYQLEADGREIIRGFFFTGEAFGYEAIYHGYYPFTVVALSDTVICELAYEDVLRVTHTNIDMQKQLLSLTSQQLTMGSYLRSSTAEQRITGFLIDLKKRLSLNEVKSDIQLPMSRQDIGNYLKLTAETISRICSRLQRKKIIAIDRKRIKFLQVDLLEKIAAGLMLA